MMIIRLNRETKTAAQRTSGTAKAVGDNPSMGHSKAEKAESHDRIVKTAANLFRELGIDGIGLADLMQRAGLTHGGFYRHFDSRDDLVAEAVQCALADGSAAVDAVTANSRSGFGALVDAYLEPGAPRQPGFQLRGHRARQRRCAQRRSRPFRLHRAGRALHAALLARLIGHLPKEARLRLPCARAGDASWAPWRCARAVNDDKLSRAILEGRGG